MATGTLKIRVVGDASKFSGAMGKVDGKLDRFSRGLNRSGRAMTKFVTGPIAAGVTGVAGFALKASAAADGTAKAARAAGMASGPFQELRFAFGQGGVEAARFEKATVRFNKRLGEAANGGGSAAGALEQLGISTRDADGNVRDATGAMDEAIKRLAGIESDAERAALAGDLFGQRVGPELAAALADGGKGIDGARKKARELGVVMSGDALSAAEKFQDQWDDLKSEFGGVIAQLGSDLLPLFTDDLVPLFRNRVVPVVKDVADKIKDATDRFSELAPETQENIFKTVAFTAAIGPLLTVGGKLVTLVKGLTFAVKGLSVAMAFLAANPIVLAATAVAGLTAGLIFAYKNSETFRRVVNKAFQAVQVAALKLQKVAVGAFQWIVDRWLWAAETVATAAAEAFGWVPGLGPKLQGAADKISTFRDDANAALNAIKDTIDIKINQKGLIDQINAANRHIANLDTKDRTIAIRYAVSGAGISTGKGDGPGRARGGTALATVRRAMSGIGGLYVTNTYRTPSENRRVGGSPNSFHLDRNNPAVDVGGNMAALDQLHAKLARIGGRELLWRTKGHWDHLHYAHTGGVVTDRGIAPLPNELDVRVKRGETILPPGATVGSDGGAQLSLLRSIDRKLDRLREIERNSAQGADETRELRQDVRAERRQQARDFRHAARAAVVPRRG